MGLLDYLYGRRDTGQPLLDQSGVDSVGNPLFVDPATSAEGKRQALEAADAALQPGSLRRAWEASETRKALNEGIPYYLGPHAAQVLDKAGALAQMATPQFGTHDAAEAGHALDAGNYGKAVGAMALGTAGAALDMIPGEALVKGVLKGATKLPALLDVAKDAAPLSIFAGIGAKTADRTALAKAEELAASGAPRSDIWQQTGWFQGADGKWRFEIPDNKATLMRPSGEYEGPAEGVFHHPDLYAAYPNLANVETRVTPEGRGGGYQSAIMDGGELPPAIRASGRNDPEIRSTMLHELQHGTQDIEGFAHGGNQYGLKPGTPAWDIYQERLQAIRTPMSEAEFKASAVGAHPDEYPYSEYLKQHKDSLKKNAAMLDRAAQDTAVQQAYRRSAGEVEARNVQARRDLTPEERAARPPWETQDVPDAQQIVRFRQDGPQMSMPLLDAAEPTQPLLRAPIRAYHGSPHDFDRFDLSKIGTGEGAQAYGHGLYFAENEGVARSYRDALSRQASSADDVAKYWLQQGGNDRAKASELFHSYAKEAGLNPAEIAETAALIEKPAGRMYEVAIHADPERFLDWDKPLKEQPVRDAVIDATRKTLPTDIVEGDFTKNIGHGITGSNAYWNYIGNGPKGSELLREAGIPGIKYLDAGSRVWDADAAGMVANYGSREKALEVAQQRLAAAHHSDRAAWQKTVDQLQKPESRNYVLFDDSPSLIEILRKYGLAGLAALPPATLASMGLQAPEKAPQ